MATKADCDICNVPMKLLGTVKNTTRAKMRRYRCEICGHEKAVFGNGWKDSDGEEYLAKQEVKRMFKQQEENEGNI